MKMLANTIAILALLLCAPLAAAQESPSTDGYSGGPTLDQPGQIPTDGAEAEQQRARLLLSSHHQLPDKELFEEYLDTPRQTLVDIALDEGQLTLYRKQALSALGYWPDVMVYEVYTDLLDDEQTPDNLRHRVMLLLADHFSGQALSHLEPRLSDDDLQIRLTAIEAIGRLDSGDAVEALEAARDDESNSVAKKRIDEAIRAAR